MKKAFRAVMAGALLTACGIGGPAQAADVTLRFSHFWPATSAQHTEIFQRWAETVQKESNGRIEVQVFPAQTLTKAAASYDAVKSRIADMTATAQGYVANRFPLSQVIELPGLIESAAQGSCIEQTLYDEGLIKGEYEDTHVLFVFTHGPGTLHMKGGAVRAPQDLVGKRVRRPTPVVGELLEAVGAQPVGIPAPEVYQALQRGVIDGIAITFEGGYVFRLNELADTHSDINLYTLAFVVTMNKQVYQSLSPDLKAVIDNNSGQKWASIAAAVFDELDRKGLADVKARGHEVVTLSAEEKQAVWGPVLKRTTESYLQELEDTGKPARKVYERAVALAGSTCAAK